MFKRIIKTTVIVAAILVLALGLFLVTLRYNDGPVEFWPWFTISIGGPFRSGEVAPSPQSWDFLKDREEIEIQTLQPATSRTVWVPVVDDRLYIVSGYMNSTLGRFWKQWPTYLEQDNRIRIRADGRIYEQRLERITEGPITAQVMSEVARKYMGAPATVNPAAGEGVRNGSVWMFEVVDR